MPRAMFEEEPRNDRLARCARPQGYRAAAEGAGRGYRAKTSLGSSHAPALSQNEILYQRLNLITDFPHAAFRLAFGVGNVPFHTPKTRNKRTGFPTTHRDKHARFSRQLVGQQTRGGRCEVNPDFLHRRYDFRMDSVGRLRSRRDRVHLGRASYGVEERRGHL